MYVIEFVGYYFLFFLFFVFCICFGIYVSLFPLIFDGLLENDNIR